MQKMLNKLASFVIALVMVLGVIAPSVVRAADAENNVSTLPDAVTSTVTLHKLIMTPSELSAWDSDDLKNKENGYDGTQNLEALRTLAGKSDLKEIPNVYFALKFASDYGTTEEEQAMRGKYVKKGDNNLTPASPLEGTDNLEEAVGGLTGTDGIKFVTDKLKGKFEIVEVAEKSTYKSEDGKSLAGSKAVPVEITLPLVNNNGTVLNAHVYPKNTEDKPEIDKNFAEDNVTEAAKYTDATSQKFFTEYTNYKEKKATMTTDIGKVIPYEVKTKVKAGTEYGKLVWKDNMTNGLTLNEGVNITATNGVSLEAEDYTLAQDNRGFTLSIKQSGLNKIKAVTKPGEDGGQDVEFTITYSATVNGTAVVDNPEKNDISIEYGHQPGKDIEEKEVTPKDGNLNVTKSWADGEDTNVPEGVIVTYTLKQGGNVKAAVTLDGSQTGTIELGNGITFEVTDKYSGTFKGLTGEGQWTFSERVAGYEPEYTTTDAAGTVTVKNNKDNDNPTPISPKEPEVVVGGKKFVKTSQTATETLAGAKFVVKKGDKYLASKTDGQKTDEQTDLENAKTQLDNAVEKYNTRADDTDEQNLKKAIDDAQKTYNEAFKKASIAYQWIGKPGEGETDNRLTFSSNAKGQFEITGFEYGNYALEEIQAPKGYAKIADIPFEIAEGNTKNVDINYEGTDSGAKNAKQVINKKVTIPQTGGIGTIIFTVAGLLLMGGAFVAMRKNREEVEA